MRSVPRYFFSPSPLFSLFLSLCVRTRVFSLFAMRLSSPELSDSPPPTRRRRPPRSLTPSSLSPNPQTSISSALPSSADDNQSQLDSYSDLPANSFTTSYTTAPPPTYINIAPLPIFHGNSSECPAAHLSRFERVRRANNASTSDMAARIFPVTLLDDAALWYEIDVEPRPDMSWNSIKSAFLRAFRRSDFADSARAELMSLRQHEDERVTAYHLRLQGILKRWPEHGLPDSLLRGLFVDRLREDFHDWVVPRRPETLAEAVRLAMDWEAAQWARAARKREAAAAALMSAATVEVEVRCGFCEGNHVEVECEVRKRMREEWMIRRREEKSGREEDGRLVKVGSLNERRSQCQCWKHQCWKKCERSTSAVTERTATTTAEATITNGFSGAQ